MGLWPGADGGWRPNFPLYHTPAILSRVFAKKVAQIQIPKLVQHYLLTFVPGCDIIITVKRGGGQPQNKSPAKLRRRLEKIFQKFLKNLLTNATKCDIIRMSKGQRMPIVVSEKNKKNPKNLLTNATKCGIIKTQKGKENPKHQKGIDTMANKVTKKDNFNALLALEQVQANAALVAFIEHELELLDKKAESRSTKPTVRQAENAEIKSAIVASMEKGKLYRCAEIQAMNEILASATGTQRTARLCNDLVSEGLLVKTVDKKVVYFALAE